MDTQHYKHLTINVSTWWLITLHCRVLLSKILYRVPFITKIMLGVGRRLVFLGKELPEEEGSRLYHKNLISKENTDAQQFGSPYGYSDAIHELVVANKYCQQVKSDDFEQQPSESAGLYKHALSRISNLFQADKETASFLDFGVGYGHIESILALEYPHIRFAGVDRSKFTKFFNDGQFSHIKNLEFFAGDIFELLLSRRFDGGVFFHARTMLLLPSSFIKKLYRAVAAAGFRYIVGIEQFGISRDTLTPYQFSDEEKHSEWYRSVMYIHNYPGLLKSAGYSVIDTELVKTNHPHKDFRFLSYLGKKY